MESIFFLLSCDFIFMMRCELHTQNVGALIYINIIIFMIFKLSQNSNVTGTESPTGSVATQHESPFCPVVKLLTTPMPQIQLRYQSVDELLFVLRWDHFSLASKLRHWSPISGLLYSLPFIRYHLPTIIMYSAYVFRIVPLLFTLPHFTLNLDFFFK